MKMKHLVGCLKLINNSFGYSSINSFIFKRSFFSPAFRCQELWKKRLESPILKKRVLEDFYYELDNELNRYGRIAAVDVDIFVNSAEDSGHVDEALDLVHKLRLNRNACEILPSTTHGVIRLLLDSDKPDELLSVLDDRLNYGLFPDAYSELLMWNDFLEKGDFKNACRVAALRMLQEENEDPLCNFLSMYSCHKYLQNPVSWINTAEPAEEEDDGEVKKVRVNYIRNPFFDNHFDLVQPNHLIGKTLMSVSKGMNHDSSLSYLLLGFILFNKLSEAESLLQSLSSQGKGVHKDVAEIIKQLKELEGEFGPLTKSLREGSNSTQSLVSEDLALPLVKNEIELLVRKTEENIIQYQQQVYREWEEGREIALEEKTRTRDKQKRLEQARAAKQELNQREQKLFFFDKEDQLDLEIERRELEQAQETERQKKEGAKIHLQKKVE